MRLTQEEWASLQKKRIRTCEGPEDVIPKTIFIGTELEDGSIEVVMKLVSVTEWKKFQAAWEGICGINHPGSRRELPRQAPQFFSIFN